MNNHVVFALDRAGFVGADGHTHHGLNDIAIMNSMPNMTVFAPRDYTDLKNILDYVSVNGDIQTKNFTEYPLKALNWRVTFGDHFVNLKDFVKQIHQVISATA